MVQNWIVSKNVHANRKPLILIQINFAMVLQMLKECHFKILK